MSWWKQLWDRLRGGEERHLFFEAEQDLLAELQNLAEQEQRPAEQVAADLLHQALARRKAAETNLLRWQTLSPREQQVAALVCLNYTNRQIAAQLGISQETVKSHIRNLLVKFDLHSKVELRQLLADWDFSEWEKN
jgi:two-component system nitrate/nitrite response regulator NarL